MSPRRVVCENCTILSIYSQPSLTSQHTRAGKTSIQPKTGVTASSKLLRLLHVIQHHHHHKQPRLEPQQCTFIDPIPEINFLPSVVISQMLLSRLQNGVVVSSCRLKSFLAELLSS